MLLPHVLITTRSPFSVYTLFLVGAGHGEIAVPGFKLGRHDNEIVSSIDWGKCLLIQYLSSMLHGHLYRPLKESVSI